jgi:glycosyltransferase involved in cell wall biosynthesis
MKCKQRELYEDQKKMYSAVSGPHHEHRVSVIIPTLNEAKNLPHVLPRIPNWVDEVLLVDGYSSDDTVEVARALYPEVRVIMQQGRGKGDALRCGFAAARGDILVMLDADGSTDPNEIPAFIGGLLAGADYAKGSRFMQGGGTSDMSLHRRLGNLGFVLGVRLLFGGSYTDLCYGYNAFWARVLPELDLDVNGFEIETLMNVRALSAGLKITEVASFEAERIFGESHLKALPDGWRVLKTILREWLSSYARTPHHNATRSAKAGRLAVDKGRKGDILSSGIQ